MIEQKICMDGDCHELKGPGKIEFYNETREILVTCYETAERFYYDQNKYKGYNCYTGEYL